MFGMYFSSLLTEDVSLKREDVYHSICSTYAALAILFFLPAQSMQQHFFLLQIFLCVLGFEFFYLFSFA